MNRPEWEEIAEDTYRLKVHNGWLVMAVHRYPAKSWGVHHEHEYDRESSSMVFVTDQTYRWEIEGTK